MNSFINTRLIRPIVSSYRKQQIAKQMDHFDSNLDDCWRKNKVVPISDEKFSDVTSFWAKYIPVPIGKQYYSLLNFIHPTIGLDTPLHEYVSESIMFPNIIRKLNPIGAVHSLSEKGMYGVLFGDINRPYEYLRVCNGTCLDNDNKQTTKEDVVKRIMVESVPVVFKHSRDSYGGHGVSVLREYDENKLISLIDSYNDNFVIQRWVKQSTQLSKLNETSLNTCRVITLLLNNKVSVIAHNVRVGGKGKDVDNVASGGMNVGVTDKGILTEGVQDEVFHIKKTPNGMLLEGYQIDFFAEICEFVKELHLRLPLCALAGWDIGLDSNDKPLLIEVNLNCPDVKNMQMINGPVLTSTAKISYFSYRLIINLI